MSKIVLELNGIDIPLPPDTDVAVTYQAKDARNISKASGSYAETIVLPDNNLTWRALGNSRFITSSTRIPYQVLKARLKLDGNAFLTGRGLHNAIEEGPAVDVDGQNADLFALVKGRKLTEIDLTDLDHTFDNATVSGSNSHDLARGYLYPLINYGRFTERELYAGNIRYDELRPAVYVRTLLERMAAPYTLTGSILQDAKFNRLVVPFTNRQFVYRESYVSHYRSKAELTQDLDYTHLVGYIAFNNIVSDPAGLFINSGSRFEVPFDGNYQVKATLKFSTNISNTSTGTFDVVVLRERPGDNQNWFEASLYSGNEQTVDIDVAVLDCIAGDMLSVFVFPAATASYTYILAGTTFEVRLQNLVFPGRPVHLEANLPDVSQEELLLAVCNMFNLLIQTDPARKTYRLDSLERMYYTSPVDWSRKIDWQQKPRFTFALEEYGQRSLISYGENEATDQNGNPLADAMVFEVDNEQLEPGKELFTSVFTFTQALPAFKGAPTLPFIPLFRQQVKKFSFWKDYAEYEPEDWVYYDGGYWKALEPNTNSVPGMGNADWQKNLSSFVFEELEATPRLLLVETRLQTIPITEDHTTAGLHHLNTYGTFEGLESATLQSEYHSITEMMLEQTRIMAINVRLKLPDINALDFLRPVILNLPAKNLQGAFYLNAVNQYQPARNQSTEVELVRLFGMKLTAESLGVTHLEFSEEFSDEFN